MENTYMSQNKLSKANLKPVLVLIGLFSVIVFIFLWIYSHAFIQINVVGADGQQVTYKIVNQETKETASSENGSGSFKKMVKRGDYEILVSNRDGAYFAVAATKSFLRSTTVEAKIEPEKKREFIGDNPGPCSYYDQALLISYSCTGDYGDVNAHMPASAATPTYTQNDGVDNFGHLSFGGIIKLNDKKMVFAEGFLDPHETTQENRLLEVNDTLAVAGSTVLKGASSEQLHKIEKYREGFVIYSEDFTSVQYYSDVQAEPQSLSIEPPDDENLAPSNISVRGEKIAVAYSNIEEVEEGDVHGEKAPGDKTAVQVFESGSTKGFMFDSGYTFIKLCGQNRLCLVDGEELTVFDISGEKQKELFKMAGVKSVESNGNQLIVVKEEAVVGIDVNSRSGSIQYSFGEYQFCGLQNAANEQGYILCVINPENSRTALYIDPQKPNEDNIDKKILTLATNLDIDSISIYKNFVYIAPEFGELVYDPAINGYGPAPPVREQVNASIAQSITDSTIDTGVYQVFRPLQ